MKKMLAACIVLCLEACGDKLDPGAVEDLDLAGQSGTWDEAAQVFAEYCIRCHGANVKGEDRNGAPENVNFDVCESASAKADKAVFLASGGAMPPDDGPSPDPKELAPIQAWIEEGAPCP